jgi:hypothetical protein
VTAGVMGAPFANATASRKVWVGDADRVREQGVGTGRLCMREHTVERPG